MVSSMKKGKNRVGRKAGGMLLYMVVLRRDSCDVTAERRAEQRRELVWRPRGGSVPSG